MNLVFVMKNKTAVEWLIDQLTLVERNLINKTFLTRNKSKAGYLLEEIFNKAKEIERKQINVDQTSIIKYKTLVINKGTEFQEFYGYKNDIGWVTSDKPINILNKDVDMSSIKTLLPEPIYDFNHVDLVTIEIKIL